MKKGLLSILIVAALMLSEVALGQDPGQRDSLIIGNLDKTPIVAGLNQQVTVPVWLRSDDSIIFVHIPVATSNKFVTSRNAGKFYPPLSSWDDKSFLGPGVNSPMNGYTTQSILAFAYLMDPRSPENFLHTGGKWIHIADYLLTTTSDQGAIGDTLFFREGINAANGRLLMGLVDGVSEVIPATYYGCVVLSGSGGEKKTSVDKPTSQASSK